MTWHCAAYPGQVVLARVGHRKRDRDVLPVDVLLVLDAKRFSQLGKVPSLFVHERARQRTKNQNQSSITRDADVVTAHRKGEERVSAYTTAPPGTYLFSGWTLTAEVYRKILKILRVGDSSAEEDGHKDCGEKAAACRRYVSLSPLVSWRRFSLYIQEQDKPEELGIKRDIRAFPRGQDNR